MNYICYKYRLTIKFVHQIVNKHVIHTEKHTYLIYFTQVHTTI